MTLSPQERAEFEELVVAVRLACEDMSTSKDMELAKNNFLQWIDQLLEKKQREVNKVIDDEIADWQKGAYHTNIAGGAIVSLRSLKSALSLLREPKEQSTPQSNHIGRASDLLQKLN